MIVSCPSCTTRYDVDPARLKGGHGRLRCARCKTLFPVEVAAAGPPAPVPAGRRLDVALVAADSGEARESLIATLAAASVRTITAETGPAALEAARRSRPRLAVLAFYLPGLLGPEVAGAIRDDPTLAATRLVLIGGPSTRGRYGSPPEAVHEVDGHLAIDAPTHVVAALFRGLLGLPGGSLPSVPRHDIEAWARVVASDLLLYNRDVVERSRSLGRRTPDLDSLLSEARRGLAATVPAARHDASALDAFVLETVRALSVRSA